MKVIAYATVKIQSERVPYKNLQMIGSKPLCYHVLEAALQVKSIDEVFVYCSDSRIKEYIPSGVTYLQREKKLDGSEIRAKDTYSAFLNEVDADVYIALGTTSPFIKSETIETALNKVLYEGYDSAFCVRRHQSFAWYKGKTLNYDLIDVPKTQDIEPVYIETSAFYIFRKEVFITYGRRIGFDPYIVEVDEIEGVDIDTIKDLVYARNIAECILKE